MQNVAGVTRVGKFSPICDYFFCGQKGFVVIFTKNGLGYILGDFFASAWSPRLLPTVLTLIFLEKVCNIVPGSEPATSRKSKCLEKIFRKAYFTKFTPLVLVSHR
jgi:hypothetical protein